MKTKKLISFTLIVLFIIGTLSACNKQNISDDTPDKSVTETPAATTPPAATESPTIAPTQAPDLSPEDQIYNDMIERSLMSVGNNKRLHQAIEKGQNGEEITIAYIGGSITEGSNASPRSVFCYAYLSSQLFAETFNISKNNLNYVNAGISGTPSTLGLLRCERDVLSSKPDVVFVEFAVNDSGDLKSQQMYESLVKKLLTSETEPAVILLFTVLDSGNTGQDHMSKIGAHYDLGMISVKNAIFPEIDAGRMTYLGGYASDYVHPSNKGHAMITEFIGYYYDMAYEKPVDDTYDIPDSSWGVRIYDTLENIELTSESITDTGNFSLETVNVYSFENGLQRVPEEENKPLVINANCKSLVFAYKQENAEDYGNADVYVDGELVGTLDGYFSGAWGNPAAKLIDIDSDSSEHTIEIKMTEGDEGKRFILLDIGFVE